MDESPSAPTSGRSRAFPAIGWAGLVAGVLDISSAFILAYRKGVGPIGVLQGVAAGLVGREAATKNGLATAGLGLAIHFFIAFVVATVFYVASRKLGFLTRHPVISGCLYGVIVYGFMYWIVMPFRLPCRAPFRLARFDRGLRAHVLNRTADWADHTPIFALPTLNSQPLTIP